MCGRYALTSADDILAELFRLAGPVSVEPRWNVAPTQSSLVVRERKGKRTASMLRWGLVPFWSKDPSVGSRMINARSETAAEKPSFRQAFRARRCLVPADAFYEWKKIGSVKQPFAIRPRDRRPWAFGGLWERWRDPDVADDQAADAWLETFTILTTVANPLLADLHLRMPVLIEPQDFDHWLDSDCDDVEALTSLCRSAAGDGMEVYPVSRDVNRVVNDAPSLLEPVPVVELEEDGGDEPLLF